MAGRAEIHPPHAGQLLKLPDVVHLEHHAGRETREFLVERRLKRKRALSREERAATRDGTAVEIDSQHEQTPATKSSGRHLGKEAAVGLRARQGGTAPPPPAARPHPAEVFDPPLHRALPARYCVL